MELLFLGKYFSFKACSQSKLTFSAVPYKHNIESYIFAIKKKKMQKPSKNTDCLSRNTVCKQLPRMCKILADDDMSAGQRDVTEVQGSRTGGPTPPVLEPCTSVTSRCPADISPSHCFQLGVFTFLFSVFHFVLFFGFYLWFQFAKTCFRLLQFFPWRS